MNNIRKLTDSLFWVGINDRRIALFENVYPVPTGMSYNSYVLLDEKTHSSIPWTRPSPMIFSKM